jgi:PAS domain-containing protein
MSFDLSGRIAVACQSRVFDATLSAITDFVYIINRDGRFLYANQALLNLWGLTSRLDSSRERGFGGGFQLHRRAARRGSIRRSGCAFMTSCSAGGS